MARLKIYASLLRDAIAPVAPLASQDAGAPAVLTQVHLETTDGYLYATCTDMLVSGIERTPVDDAEAGFETCVDVHDLRRQLDLLAPLDSGYNPRLILEATPGGLVVQYEPYQSSHPAGTFHLQAFPVDSFPKLRDGIRHALALEPRGVMAFAVYAKVFARFATASRGEPLRFRFTGDRRAPILVSAGDSFLGMVMPANVTPGTTFEPNAWPELFGDGDVA